jgi:hypothetical protein
MKTTTELYASGDDVALEDWTPLSKVSDHSLVHERWTDQSSARQIADVVITSRFSISYKNSRPDKRGYRKSAGLELPARPVRRLAGRG